MAFCLGLTPAYDVFGVVSSGVWLFQQFQNFSLAKSGDEGLKYLKIDEITLHIVAVRPTGKVYPV